MFKRPSPRLSRASDVDCHRDCEPLALFRRLFTTPHEASRPRSSAPWKQRDLPDPEPRRLTAMNANQPKPLATPEEPTAEAITSIGARPGNTRSTETGAPSRHDTTQRRSRTEKGHAHYCVCDFSIELEHDLGRPITAQETLSRRSWAELPQHCGLRRFAALERTTPSDS